LHGAVDAIAITDQNLSTQGDDFPQRFFRCYRENTHTARTRDHHVHGATSILVEEGQLGAQPAGGRNGFTHAETSRRQE
jgi:hypothetical protein